MKKDTEQNIGTMAFEVKVLMEAVEEGKTVYPHICEAVVLSLKDFCEEVLKTELHEEVQPVLSLDDLKKTHAFLREKASSLSYHTGLEAKKYATVANFLGTVLEAGELDAKKVEKLLDETSNQNFFRALAKDISIMRGKRQPDELDERLGLAVEKISGGVFREDAEKAIELLKKGEATGLGNPIEEKIGEELERNLEKF